MKKESIQPSLEDSWLNDKNCHSNSATTEKDLSLVIGNVVSSSDGTYTVGRPCQLISRDEPIHMKEGRFLKYPAPKRFNGQNI